MNKYGNHKTELDGILFDSKKEANRYAELKILERAKLIKDLKLQPSFNLLDTFTNGANKTVRGVTYIADFAYYDLEKDRYVVEDVKSEGTKTQAYGIKKKLFESKYHPLVIEEV